MVVTVLAALLLVAVAAVFAIPIGLALLIVTTVIWLIQQTL